LTLSFPEKSDSRRWGGVSYSSHTWKADPTKCAVTMEEYPLMTWIYSSVPKYESKVSIIQNSDKTLSFRAEEGVTGVLPVVGTVFRKKSGPCTLTRKQSSQEAPVAGPIPSCHSIDLRTAASHTKCMTSKGAVFERVQIRELDQRLTALTETWKDPDGRIWGDVIAENPHVECIRYDGLRSGRVARNDDYVRGELHGIREVLRFSTDRPYENAVTSTGDVLDTRTFRAIWSFYDSKTGELVEKDREFEDHAAQRCMWQYR
jgi:hypothetical protein